jgi:butyryl-CoA dehydrogenase
VFLADATLYLEFFGIVAVAWQWLLQGLAAQKALDIGTRKKDLNFYHGKLFTMRYFYKYELPKTLGLAKRLTDDDHLTVTMKTEFFDD